VIAAAGVVALRASGPADPSQNTRSLAVARRLGFVQEGEVNGEPFFTRGLG